MQIKSRIQDQVWDQLRCDVLAGVNELLLFELHGEFDEGGSFFDADTPGQLTHNQLKKDIKRLKKLL